MSKIRITSSHEIADAEGDVRILCTMSDGSKWSCDLELKKWRKEIPTSDELTESFNNFLGQ